VSGQEWDAYPSVPRNETSKITYRSELNGSVTVADPYVGLEDSPDQSAETKVGRKDE
jgi:hypothetical protein